MIPFQIDTKAFILSNPRSGSTLLRLLLNSNRKVVSLHEYGFLHYLFERYNDWKLNDLKIEKFNIFFDDFSRIKKINTWKIDLGKLKYFIQQVAPPNYEKLTELICWFYKNKANGMLSVWKSVLKISPYKHKREVRIKITNCEQFLSRKYFQNKDYLNAFKVCFNALKNNPF